MRRNWPHTTTHHSSVKDHRAMANIDPFLLTDVVTGLGALVDDDEGHGSYDIGEDCLGGWLRKWSCV